MNKFKPIEVIKRISVFLILTSMLLSACAIPETPPITVVLSNSTLEVEVGESVNITALVSDGSPVEWLSSNEACATVDSNGKITAVSPGKADIMALAGGEVACCTVTVFQSEEDAYIFMPLILFSLKLGESYTVPCYTDAQNINWVSSNTSVALVDDGTVLGVSVGTTKILAYSGKSVAECIVTVTSSGITSTVSLSSYQASVRVEENLQLSATATDGARVTWISSNEEVVTVKDGVVKGISEGTATVTALSALASAECQITVRPVTDTYKPDYQLVWNDEFSGNELNGDKWNYMLGVQDKYGSSTGPMFWGNNEQQYYTEDSVSVSDGTLKITAKKESAPNKRKYTSGRICTRNKGAWTYGYFEARIKLPTINGLWPAFWMLPEPSSTENSNNEYGYWASSGEIDIMEVRGRLPYRVETTLHYGNLGSSTYQTKTTIMTASVESWHTYAIEWRERYIAWFIDGLEVFRLTNDEWWSEVGANSETAPFDVNFYILLNLAVGGNFDGGIEPDENFTSADMVVDYVRVYSAAN